MCCTKMALSLSRQCKHFTLTNFFEKREKLYKEKKLKAYAHHQVSPFLGGWGQDSVMATPHPHPHPHRRSASAGQKNQLPQPKQRSPKPKQDTKTSKTTAKGVREKKLKKNSRCVHFPKSS
jgi:hypothetical protein